MKKSTIYLYIILFIVICVLPSPLYSLLGDYIDKENYENRVAATTPKFSLSTLQSYPKEYEEYFNDSVPFRSKLIEANSLIDYFIFKRSPVSRVILGKDDWLFYNPNGTDGDPIADFTGANILSEEKMVECASNLISVRDTLLKQGKEFVVMIAPNKATIYSEYFPSNYRKAEQTKADLLVDYLKKNTDLTIVYPKDELLNAKTSLPNHLLYYKTDTHWNAIGAYIGANSLLSTLNVPQPSLDKIKIIEKEKHAGDLVNMMAMSKYLKYDVNHTLEIHAQTPVVNSEFPINDNQKIIHHTTTGQDERTLFLVHDSFSDSMIPYFRTEFNNFYSMHKNFYDPEFLAQVNPDIVVLEVVERYIDSLFTFKVNQ